MLEPPTPEDLVSVYWLADYFEVPQLKHDLERALAVEIHCDSMFCKYLGPAQELGVESVIATVVDAFAKDILYADDYVWGFEDDMSSSFLLAVLQKMTVSEKSSFLMSGLIADFFQTHSIDADTFRTLTDAERLPHIQPSTTWTFLKIESELIESSQSCSLSSLQERCINSLSGVFLEIDFTSGPITLQSISFQRLLISKAQQHIRREGR
ncbi:hypothetical protein MPSEU_000925600 [Mayamaea pseudoterrestris]|nr:hypothetical protein MPSEU_000925600 [Mayamaea pseudoterrestris]